MTEQTPSLNTRLDQIAMIMKDDAAEAVKKYENICVELGIPNRVPGRNRSDYIQIGVILYERIERHLNLLEQRRIADSVETSAHAAEQSAKAAVESGRTARHSMRIAFGSLIVSIVLATVAGVAGMPST